MNGPFSSIVRTITMLSLGSATALSAMEINSTGNEIFDLYFFGNGEAGMYGTPTGNYWQDVNRQTSGTVKDSSTYYWNEELKQAMLNAVNTWTSAITTEYDTTKHARKLRIGFFLDDGSTVGGVMARSMAGYATTQTVYQTLGTNGSKANIYSVAEWAWRENNETAYYAKPPEIANGVAWETNLLPGGANNIDMAIVLNPVITSYGFDATGTYFYNETARTAQELQNVATHEIGHGMGMNSYMYTQTYDSSGNSVAALSGNATTWDSLLTLDGKYIYSIQDGELQTQYNTLSELQAAGWEVPEGKDPYDSASYTGDEIQYDEDRRLSLEGEVGVHIAALMLEGDTMEHISYGDGTNVLGPGGRLNSDFSENDLRALELLGWEINRYNANVPEPSSGVLLLLGLSGLAMRRRRP